jgi:hypothetical protein
MGTGFTAILLMMLAFFSFISMAASGSRLLSKIMGMTSLSFLLLSIFFMSYGSILPDAELFSGDKDRLTLILKEHHSDELQKVMDDALKDDLISYREFYNILDNYKDWEIKHLAMIGK